MVCLVRLLAILLPTLLSLGQGWKASFCFGLNENLVCLRRFGFGNRERDKREGVGKKRKRVESRRSHCLVIRRDVTDINIIIIISIVFGNGKERRKRMGKLLLEHPGPRSVVK